MTIQISCIVLSYNGGDSLIRTLESCKLQTYPYKDLVIADDASTDSGYTISVIEKWLTDNSKYFTNVLFIKNTNNMGIVKNLRNAALHAMGEILFTLGQGDTVYGPDTLADVSDAIQNQRKNYTNEHPIIWLAYYKSFSLDPTWHIVQHEASLPFHFRMLQRNPQKALSWLAHVSFIGGVSFIYHKDYFGADSFPLPSDVRDIEDYSSTLWVLAHNIKVNILPFYARWYEMGVGISCDKSKVARDKVLMTKLSICDWVVNTFNLSPSLKKLFITKKSFLMCKSKQSKLIHHPLFFLKTVYIIMYTKLYCKIYSMGLLNGNIKYSKNFSKDLFVLTGSEKQKKTC